MSHDMTSFQQLYKEYSGDVYRFSFWLSGDSDEAKDITSEVFVRVWTSTSEIRNGSVKAYLFAIARNLHLRARKKKKRFAPLDDATPDSAIPPDLAAGVRIELEETLRALMTLPEIDRTVLAMRANDELSYEEIARATGLSLSATKVKIFRARLKLQSLISSKRGGAQ